MRNRGWVEYFLFSRKERIAIISLLVLIAAVFFMPMILLKNRKRETFFSEVAFEQERQQLKAVMESSSKKEKGMVGENEDERIPYISSIKESNHQLFNFDPNTITGEEWQKLGLPQHTILTIQRYLSKGGRFREPADIGKIYGIRSVMVKRLLPYVQIQLNSKSKNFQVSKNIYTNSSEQGKQTKDFRNLPININAADTTLFISLPGIGSKLAQRIINFREKLGGFYSVDQLAETFGLPDSVFQKNKARFVCENLTIRKININKATAEELKVHPYIKWNLANAIVAYRSQHGLFQTPEHLNQLAILNEEAFVKLLPYLCVQ